MSLASATDMRGSTMNHHVAPQDFRNKYNTLTPAEAKRLNRHLSGKRPIRTASVLHKPRAPPIPLPAELDSNKNATESRYGTAVHSIGQQGGSLRRVFASNGVRCVSACSNNSSPPEQRYSQIYGSAVRNAANRRYAFAEQNDKRVSPSNDSDSNLSFRSSLDIVDSAYGSDRLQTMSVDLGNPGQHYHQYGTLQRNNHHIYCTPPKSDRSPSSESRNLQESSRALNESFYSAKSDCKFKSASKLSLTSSTSKVLKDQLSNFKKFFRINPSRSSFIGNRNAIDEVATDQKPEPPKVNNVASSRDQNMADYINDLYINKSLSPPKCPPPPGELKSMRYMESNLDYSNYDEFTSLRNQRNSALLMNSVQRAENKINNIGPTATEDIEEDSWQMSSLPVAFERNLTTVIEEKNQQKRTAPSYLGQNSSVNIEPQIMNGYIKPPQAFVDSNFSNRSSGISHTSSNQSLTSVTTTDSVLDFHRQTATAFRFSYGQPNGYQPNDASLPPRTPTCEPIKLTAGGDVVECLDNDGDTTLLSDTSTLHGDSSRCAELERTIESLKDKLIAKEKELTDLQLKQWSSDYLIDQLKSTISRLERENAQLKKKM